MSLYNWSSTTACLKSEWAALKLCLHMLLTSHTEESRETDPKTTVINVLSSLNRLKLWAYFQLLTSRNSAGIEVSDDGCCCEVFIRSSIWLKLGHALLGLLGPTYIFAMCKQPLPVCIAAWLLWWCCTCMKMQTHWMLQHGTRLASFSTRVSTFLGQTCLYSISYKMCKTDACKVFCGLSNGFNNCYERL